MNQRDTPVGRKRYAIVDEWMLREAAEKVAALAGGALRGKVVDLKA